MHFGIERISWIFHFVLVFRISSVSHLLETNLWTLNRSSSRLWLIRSQPIEVLEEIDRDIKLFFSVPVIVFLWEGIKMGKWLQMWIKMSTIHFWFFLLIMIKFGTLSVYKLSNRLLNPLHFQCMIIFIWIVESKSVYIRGVGLTFFSRRLDI